MLSNGLLVLILLLMSSDSPFNVQEEVNDGIREIVIKNNKWNIILKINTASSRI